MGYNELTDLSESDGKALEEKIAQREIQIRNLISDFIDFYDQEHQVTLVPIHLASFKLTEGYYALLDRYAKPFVDDKVNRFKMAAILKLLIVKEQILIHPQNDPYNFLNRDVNARFGLAAALSLIDCMISNANKPIIPNTRNVLVDTEFENLIKAHLDWLKTKPLNDFPFYLNAQFLQLMHFTHSAAYEIN